MAELCFVRPATSPSAEGGPLSRLICAIPRHAARPLKLDSAAKAPRRRAAPGALK